MNCKLEIFRPALFRKPGLAVLSFDFRLKLPWLGLGLEVKGQFYSTICQNWAELHG